MERNDMLKTKYIVNDILSPLWQDKGICVVGVAQFRKGDQFAPKTQEDVKGASDLYYLASNILYLHQTEKQKKENYKRDLTVDPYIISLDVLKGRDGGGMMGTHFLDFHATKCLFQYNSYGSHK